MTMNNRPKTPQNLPRIEEEDMEISTNTQLKVMIVKWFFVVITVLAVMTTMYFFVNHFTAICISIFIALVGFAIIQLLNRYATDKEPRRRKKRQTEDERNKSEASDVRLVKQNATRANWCVLFITIFAMYFFPLLVYHYKNGSNEKNEQTEIRFLPVQEISDDKNPWNFETIRIPWNFETICISIMIALANFATIQRISPYHYWERTFMMISMVMLYYMVFFFVLNDHLIPDHLMQKSFFVILVWRCYLNSRDVKLVDIPSFELKRA
jgi:L-lactate permease